MSDPSAAAKWSTFLEEREWQKGSLDASSYEALLRAGSLGIEKGIAIGEVSRRILATGALLRAGKLRQQAERAYFGVDRHRRNPMPSPGNGSSKLDWGHRRICSRSYSKDSGMIPHLDVAIDCASSRRSVPPRAEEPAPGSSDRTSGSRN
jgi:hypothetical protein